MLWFKKGMRRMAMHHLNEIYERIRALPLKDRLRLVERVMHDAQENVSAPLGARPLGMDKGKIWIAEDFDAPLPEEMQRLFNGES